MLVWLKEGSDGLIKLLQDHKDEETGSDSSEKYWILLGRRYTLQKTVQRKISDLCFDTDFKEFDLILQEMFQVDPIRSRTASELVAHIKELAWIRSLVHR